jgi:hypothetical protein
LFGTSSSIRTKLWLSLAVGAILVKGPNHQTNFWKRTIQWLFHQNFFLIEQMVSEKKIFMGISHRVHQNCSILSQNVPKFELCKHNDELLSIYYRIFYELWTFADFDRLCRDHPCQVWFNLIQRFQRRRFKCDLLSKYA